MVFSHLTFINYHLDYAEVQRCTWSRKKN